SLRRHCKAVNGQRSAVSSEDARRPCSAGLSGLTDHRQPLTAFSRGRIRNAELGEALEIAAPFRFAVAAQLVQIRPAVQPGAVAVVEQQSHCVRAYRFDARDAHLVLADLQRFLARTMTADFGGW